MRAARPRPAGRGAPGRSRRHGRWPGTARAARRAAGARHAARRRRVTAGRHGTASESRAGGRGGPMPPPGPFRPTAWRSPLRGPWLTAVLGSVLLVLLTSSRSRASRRTPPTSRACPPTRSSATTCRSTSAGRAGPAWLYAVTQGLHVNLGLAAIPRADRQAVVGDPAAVRVAAGRRARPGGRARDGRAARRRPPGSSSRRASRTSRTGTRSASTSSACTTTAGSSSWRRSPPTSWSRSRWRCARTASGACCGRCATPRPSRPRRAGSPPPPPRRRRSRAAACSA